MDDSPVSRWLEKRRSRDLGPWQFRLSHLFWLTVAVAIGATVTKQYGPELWLSLAGAGSWVALLLAPPLIVFVFAALGRRKAKRRRRPDGLYLAFVLCFAIFAAPWAVLFLLSCAPGLIVLLAVIWPLESFILYRMTQSRGFRYVDRFRARRLPARVKLRP